MTDDDEPQVVGRRRVPKIPEIIPAPKRCSICNDPRKTAYVDAQLAKGYSAAFIAGVLTDDMNLKTGAQSILTHRKHYIPIPSAAKKPADLAILIRDATIEAVQEGRLEPSIRDGLAAVQILDKRAAATTDRQMFLMMARALAGYGPIGLLEPPDDLVIEGEAYEVVG
jgi:hypothetical protein